MVQALARSSGRAHSQRAGVAMNLLVLAAKVRSVRRPLAEDRSWPHQPAHNSEDRRVLQNLVVGKRRHKRWRRCTSTDAAAMGSASESSASSGELASTWHC